MKFPFDVFSQTPSPLIVYLVLAWSLFWKGLALWRAAVEKQRNWFIAMLILNTIGLLEIVFLFRFAKRKLTLQEIKSWIYQSRQQR